MKVLAAVLLLVAVVAAQEEANLRGDVEEHPHHWDLLGHSKTMDGVIELWHKFTAFFKKTYSAAEREVRLLHFKNNLDFINRYNSEQEETRLGLTPFTDLSFEEFEKMFLNNKIKDNFRLEGAEEHIVDPTVEAKKSIDWVEKGAVTPVKNQGTCGSCWAFSTVSSLESHYQIKFGELKEFSEQELVDCATSHYDNHGCSGGLYTHAFDFIQDNKGISTEKDYPYKCLNGKSSECLKAKCEKDVKKYANVSGYVTCRSESDMEDAMNKGPISIAVEVTPIFQHYTGGILKDNQCGEQLNHAIVAVGMGEEDGKKFWKVRNSWSADWGEQGYIRMKRGENQCGLAMIPVYPKIGSKDE